VRYRGKSWADDANTLRVEDATVFDAGIRYERNDWKDALNVTNLFDKYYVGSYTGGLDTLPTSTSAFVNFGSPRAISGTFVMAF